MRSLIPAAILVACASPAQAAGDAAPICADRPSKSTGPCTVPPGHAQIETGLIDWSRDTSGGVRTDLVVLGSSLIKYGISGRADVELGITPLETLHLRSAGSSERHSSVGDLLLRVKYRLTAAGAPVEVALDPFTKVPTANRRLGNGKLEAGFVAPISAQLGTGPLTLSLDPEQVIVFKRFRRRVFLMTPVHHHFEMAAWSETKIIVRFWLIAAIFAAVGFTLYFNDLQGLPG